MFLPLTPVTASPHAPSTRLRVPRRWRAAIPTLPFGIGWHRARAGNALVLQSKFSGVRSLRCTDWKSSHPSDSLGAVMAADEARHAGTGPAGVRGAAPRQRKHGNGVGRGVRGGDLTFPGAANDAEAEHLAAMFAPPTAAATPMLGAYFASPPVAMDSNRSATQSPDAKSAADEDEWPRTLDPSVPMWKQVRVGDQVMSPWSGDGQLYHAVVGECELIGDRREATARTS